MKNIDLLIEKYIGLKVNHYNESSILAIYENPTRLYLKSLKEEHVDYLRFFIHMENNDLYVWNAETLLHNDVWNNLKFKPTMYEYGYYKNSIMVAGYGSIRNNKIRVDDIMYDKDFYKETTPDLSQFKILDLSDIEYRNALHRY